MTTAHDLILTINIAVVLTLTLGAPLLVIFMAAFNAILFDAAGKWERGGGILQKVRGMRVRVSSFVIIIVIVVILVVFICGFLLLLFKITPEDEESFS